MGGSSKKVTVGYDYYLSADFVVSTGDIDAVHEFIYGERTMWKGYAGASADVLINAPNLFGGRKREGGVKGLVSMLFGSSAQGRHPFLQAHIGAEVPAYRGYFRLLFQNFMWSSMNPYFKPLWVRASKITQGWGIGACWYPEKAAIGRRAGEPTPYKITVSWVGENIKQAQSIQYRLRYRLVTDVAFTDIADATFTGGSPPSSFSANGNGGGTLGNTPTVYNSYLGGTVPQDSREHTITLPAADYVFDVVKLNGTRTIPAVTGSMGVPSSPAVVLTGMAYGGAATVSSYYAVIPNYADMNAAHIIYRLLTDPIWRVNLPSNMIDDVSWRAAADTLFAERFGLSFEFDTGEDTQNHVQRVLDHINGYFKHDLITNTIMLRLIRDEPYEGLTLLDNDNSSCTDFQYAMFGADIPSEILVSYRDENEDPKLSAPATNMAAAHAQGGTIRKEVTYEGVHRADLAYALARRDAKVLGTTLAKMTRECSRILWNHSRGDAVLVTDETLGIANAPYRIVAIDKGTSDSAKITVELLEDVFGLDVTQYSFTNPAYVYDQDTPAPSPFVRIIEAPYYLIHIAFTATERAALSPGYGFALPLVQRASAGAFSTAYDLYASLDNSLYLSAAENGEYSPCAVLNAAIDSKSQTDFTVSGLSDWNLENIDTSADLIAIIGNELMAVDSLDTSTGDVSVRRAVGDTVPLLFAAGTRVMLISTAAAIDQTTRLIGDTVSYKAQPVSAAGAVTLETIVPESLTFARRAERPYAPGDFKINGTYWPDDVDIAADIVLSWAHRDRTTQLATLVGFYTAGGSAEVGTTYTVEIYDGATLLRSVDSIAADTYTYTLADMTTDGDIETLTFRVFSERDGLSSSAVVEHTFTRI